MSQDIDYINYENVSLGASFESEVINIVPFKGGYIQLAATGNPVGTLLLKASNDPGPLQAVNWETIPYSTMLINGAGLKYIIKSKEGKTLGEYSSEKDAKKRLRQIEYFKHVSNK